MPNGSFAGLHSDVRTVGPSLQGRRSPTSIPQASGQDRRTTRSANGRSIRTDTPDHPRPEGRTSTPLKPRPAFPSSRARCIRLARLSNICAAQRVGAVTRADLSDRDTSPAKPSSGRRGPCVRRAASPRGAPRDRAAPSVGRSLWSRGTAFPCQPPARSKGPPQPRPASHLHPTRAASACLAAPRVAVGRTPGLALVSVAAAQRSGRCDHPAPAPQRRLRS